MNFLQYKVTLRVVHHKNTAWKGSSLIKKVYSHHIFQKFIWCTSCHVDQNKGHFLKCHFYLLWPQSFPVHPATHAQVLLATPSVHVAPFLHGLVTHSSMSKILYIQDFVNKAHKHAKKIKYTCFIPSYHAELFMFQLHSIKNNHHTGTNWKFQEETCCLWLKSSKDDVRVIVITKGYFLHIISTYFGHNRSQSTPENMYKFYRLRHQYMQLHSYKDQLRIHRCLEFCTRWCK